MIYFVVVGLIMVFILKRNPISLLTELTFRVPWLIIGCLLLQFLLAWLTAKNYWRSTLLLELTFVAMLIGLFYNRHYMGIKWMITGTALNLLALFLHNGLMPVSRKAMQIAQLSITDFSGDSRHQWMDTSDSWWFGDWIPLFKHVISPGDLFIGIGTIIFIVYYSRKRVV